MVAWRRLGREHGEDKGFRVNPPDVIEAHLQSTVDRFRKTPPDDWRWWQVSKDLIIVKPISNETCGPDAIIYYLPGKNCVIMENASYESLPEWPWYIHIGSTEFHDELDSWVFTDLFADIVVQSDTRTHSVLDLDDLAYIVELELIGPSQLTQVLVETQHLIDSIRYGRFPPPELADRHEVLGSLGWDR